MKRNEKRKNREEIRANDRRDRSENPPTGFFGAFGQFLGISGNLLVIYQLILQKSMAEIPFIAPIFAFIISFGSIGSILWGWYRKEQANSKHIGICVINAIVIVLQILIILGIW